MGAVVCKKHKTTGAVLTCSHLSKKVWNFQEILDYVKREERENPDDKYDWLKADRIYCLCKSCDREFIKLKFAEFSGVFWHPACANCFLELSDLESWN